MRINNINNINRAYGVNYTDRVSIKSKSIKKDSVAISSFAKEMQIAKKALKNTPDIRQDRVNEIKEKIKSGKYNISSEKIADKMVNSMFDTIG